MSNETSQGEFADLDPQLVADFVEEANEFLPDVAAGFVELESKPGDAEILHRIFRGIHTIKGNAAFLGFRKIRNLSHKMEDLLGNIREGQVESSQENIDCLLAGLDELRNILGRVTEGKDHVAPEHLEEFEALLGRLEFASQPILPACEIYLRVLGQLEGMRTQVSSGELDPAEALELLRSRLLRQIPEATLEAARKLEADPRTRLRKILTPRFEGRLGEEKSRQVLDALEELQWGVGEDTGAPLIQEGLAQYQAKVYTVGFEPELRAKLMVMLDELASLEAKQGISIAPPPNEEQDALIAAGSSGSEVSTVPHRTMRVEEHKVDEFLDYVGELIITREMFGNIGKRLRVRSDLMEISSEFQRAMEAFTALSHDLQNSIMEVRKLPMKVALQRAPRIVRDLAHQLGKNAQVEMIGTGISVDKSLIEAFEGPLTHMLRNAVDHGLELPDDREAQGKSPVGTVRVEVSETPDEVLISIQDDGRGIDSAALCRSALKKGLVDEVAAQALSEQEALRLLFLPGFSTAAVVTDVSGRGVGMDVVARNVDELGGRVEISTELGSGTRFCVYLPKSVTVQIVDGFLVRVAGQRILLPLASISESFRPSPQEVYTVAERGECVHRRGKVFPLLRLADLLRISKKRTLPYESIVVSVELQRDQTAGILVDEVLGVQQVVVREVTGVSTEAEIFSGGAVLGDGRIAMVLDIERLSSLLQWRANETPPSVKAHQTSSNPRPDNSSKVA